MRLQDKLTIDEIYDIADIKQAASLSYVYIQELQAAKKRTGIQETSKGCEYKKIEWLMSQENTKLFLARYDTMPVGFSYATALEEEYMIENYYVIRDARNKDAGKKIIQKNLDYASENGFFVAAAIVLSENISSQRVFESMHFSRREEQDYLHYERYLR